MLVGGFLIFGHRKLCLYAECTGIRVESILSSHSVQENEQAYSPKYQSIPLMPELAFKNQNET